MTEAMVMRRHKRECGSATDEVTATIDLVQKTERRRLEALVQTDMGTAERLQAEDFQLINPKGRVISKGEYLYSIAARGSSRWTSDRVHHYWHTDLHEQRAGA